MTFQTINPATEQIIQSYQEMAENEVNNIITATHEAFLQWRQTSFAERAELMNKCAAILQKNKEEYAKLITQEMGKPIKQARSEIEKCAWVCNHYAKHAEEYLAPIMIKTEMQKSYVTYKPIGIVFAIMPWNFPFWQVFRFAAPTLMAGNAALLKHAPISTGAALAIEKLFAEAGMPKNLFRSLILTNEGAEKVIQHPYVAAVTLTGSDRAGKAVGSESGKALKKVVLELGGSDPYLILEDADLDLAAEACVNSRLNNAGQVCIAAKRLIVVNAVREKFTQLVIEKAKRYIMGNPMEESTILGPMARKDIRAEVHKQVSESVANGAKLITGGKIPEKQGFYYPPTILDDVAKGMPAYDQEIFGPVLAFIHAKDEDEAIQLGNDTSFGLAAAVFTKDIARGEKIAAEKMEAGSCAVNTFVASDPRLPFGGIKHSGYGRELNAEGIRAFVNVKTVSIK